MKEHDENMVRTALIGQRNQLRSSLSNARATINRLSSDQDVRAWAMSTPGEPIYYYSGMKILNTIKEESAYQSNIDYSIAVTTPDPDSFVISSSSTASKGSYTAPADLFSGPGIYPDGNSVTFNIRRRIESAEVSFICTLILPEALTGSDEIMIAFYDQRNDSLLSLSDDFRDTAEKEKWLLDNSDFRDKRVSGFVDSYSDLGFSIIYGYKIKTLTYPVAVIMAGFFLMIVTASLFLSWATRNLYKPVGEVMKSLDAPQSAERDEFKEISDSCRKIEALSGELGRLLEEQRKNSESQKYRAYIKGVPYEKAPDDGDAFFTLAALMFDIDEGSDQHILFAELDSCSREIEHMHFVRTMSDMAVLVSKRKDKDESRSILINLIQSFSKGIKSGSSLISAVTDTHRGSDSIRNDYRRAQELIANRYRIKGKTIITEADVQGESMGLIFPLNEEKRLINALLATSPEALSIYDHAIEANLSPERQLTPDELLRFSFTMIGLAMRFFQELRIEPERIVGHEIDWKALYSCQNPLEILRDIRSILKSALDAKMRQEEDEGSKTIREMKEYINSNYKENLMLLDLATEFNLTPKYCSQLFGELSDEGFKNYLNRIRIEKACEILGKNPGIKISSLSTEVGFSSSNTFIRVFSKYMGVTPKLYAERISHK